MSDYCLYCAQRRRRPEGCAICGPSAPGQAVPPEAFVLPPGTILRENYIIARPLGRGGFGITYLGVDRSLDMRVAIKEHLPREVAGRLGEKTVAPLSQQEAPAYRETLNRFAQEGRALARLSDHPNIVQVLSFFEAHGTAYLVMRYLDGQTLEERCATRGPLPDTEAVEIAIAVLDGLRAVHRADMVHRDVKPANIFITTDGLVKLLDFGSARDALRNRPHTMTRLWTEGYAPLEQQRSAGKMGPWSDVYGAGATLYRMLVGEKPPDAASERAAPNNPVALVPPHEATDGRVSKHLSDVVCKALAIKADDRYQTAEQMQQALFDALNESVSDLAPPPEPSPPTPNPPEPPRPPRSTWKLIMAAGGILAGGVTYSDWSDCDGMRDAPSVGSWQRYLDDHDYGMCRDEALAAIEPIKVGCPEGVSTLSAGLREAISGSQIFVCPGEYVENITIDKPITLSGTGDSPADIRIVSAQSPVLTIRGAATVEDVTVLTTGDGWAISAASGRSELQDVHTNGLSVTTDSSVSARELQVQDAPGDGIEVKGNLVLKNSRVEGSGENGMVVNGTATVTDSEVVDNGKKESDGACFGVVVYGALTMSGGEVSGNHWSGVIVSSGSATIDKTAFTNNGQTGVHALSNGVASLSNVESSGNGYHGASSDGHATLEVESSELSDNKKSGLYVYGDSTASVSDSRFKNNGHSGALSKESATLNIKASEMSANIIHGLYVYGEGTASVLSSTLNENGNQGTQATNNGIVNIRDSELANNDFGVALFEDTTLNLSSVRVYGNKTDGIWLGGCKSAVAADSEFFSNSDDGIEIGSDCNPTIEGSTIRDNRYGIRAASSATGTIKNSTFKNNKTTSAGDMDDIILRDISYQ